MRGEEQLIELGLSGHRMTDTAKVLGDLLGEWP
jgi:hypothetical protein